MTSFYPPGFGSPSDLDHVEGPLFEEEMNERCPDCDSAMYRIVWRASAGIEMCLNCDYEREAPEIEEDGPW